MHPWPSPCRRSRAFPEMIAISPASLSTMAEPCQGRNHTLSLHSMSEQTCVLSINVSVDHRRAFPSQPSRAAEAASPPRAAQGPLPLFLPGPGELPAGLLPGSAQRALTQGLGPKEAQLTSPGAPLGRGSGEAPSILPSCPPRSARSPGPWRAKHAQRDTCSTGLLCKSSCPLN